MTTSVVSPLQPLCSPSHGMWPRPNGGGGPRPSSQSVAKSAGFGVRRGKSASVEYSALCLTTTRRQGSMGLGAQTALWLASPRLASPRLASLCLARHRRPCPCWAVQRPVQRGRTVQHRWQEAKKDAERYAWLCECVTIGGLYFISVAACAARAGLLPFVASSRVGDSSNIKKSSTKSSNKNG